VNWQAGQSGEAYVINQGVTVVDIASQAVQRVIPIQMESGLTGPLDSCLSPNGLIAIDVRGIPGDHEDLSELFLVDPVAGTFRNLSPPYYEFYSCAFSNDGELLYGFGATLQLGSYSLVALDVVSGKVAQTWRLPIDIAQGALPLGQGIRVLTGGQVVLVTFSNSGGFVYVFDPGAGTVNYWAPGFQPVTLALAPSGLLYISGQAANGTEKDVTIDPLLIGSTTNPVVTGTPSPLQGLSYLTWPTSDPWYAYRASGGLGGPTGGTFQAVSPDLTNDAENQVLSGVAPPNCLGPALPALTYGVASHRDASATDTFLALCNGELDFFTATQPPTLYSVVNSGSLQPAPVAPGSFISLFGYLLGSPDENDTPGAAVARQLGSTSVQLDGQPLRLYFVGEGQVNAALPQNLASGRHGLIVQKGNLGRYEQITVVDQNIAAFTWVPDPNSAPNATAPIVTDGQYHLIGDPALGQGYAQLRSGDTGVIWATGGGSTNPLVDDTVVFPPGPFQLAVTPPVLVDSTNVAVPYAGRAPGTASLDQINFVVPAGLSSGPHDLTLGTITYKAALWIE
jgi:uncharacterized protein (TIGR03437 family)